MLAALGGALGSGAPAGAAAATATTAGTCRTVHVPVTLPAGVPDPAPDQVVSALYCTPTAAAQGRPIQVLVPGATYDSDYWNWQHPAFYSWTARALATGSAVLDYDRLGTGASTSPPAADLTVQGDAYVLHQVLGWVRHSAGYTNVNLIGHSMGSAIAAQDAGTWPADASRLVLTGMLNYNSPASSAAMSTAAYPASDDPQFPQAGPGYLTTVPGVRSTLFYDTATASAAVISWDEGHKSVAAADEFATMAALFAAPPAASITNLITAPVLIVVGQEDALFCSGTVNCADPASTLAYEKPYFPQAATLSLDTIPGTGHDLALHPSTVVSFARVTGWLATTAPGHG
jgi:pimeloyl-ACP methyl ester carboxylesterase